MNLYKVLIVLLASFLIATKTFASSVYQDNQTRSNVHQTQTFANHKKNNLFPVKSKIKIALFKKELFKKQHSPPGDGTVINILAFVLAVLSIPLCWIPVLGLLLSVAALVLGIIGAGRTLKGLGIAAIVIGAITLIISLIITLIFI